MNKHEAVHILLVEDNPGDVRLAREALKAAGIATHLHVACDGEEAIAFLRREGPFGDARRPDMIMLDLNLPRLDGRGVLDEIKRDDDLRCIPVVVITSSDVDSDVIDAYDLNRNCYITKPGDLETFAGVVESIENFWFNVVKLPPQ